MITGSIFLPIIAFIIDILFIFIWSFLGKGKISGYLPDTVY